MHSLDFDTDEKLLDLLRHGDEHAFASLFDRHWDNVFRMIYSRIRDKAVAEEMAQEIFMKLWNKRSELSINNFSAYAYTTVKNKCINYIESCVARKRGWDYYKQFLPDHDNLTEEVVKYNDLRNALDKGLNMIPKKSKLIFKLNRLEGFSIKEIAEKLNLSEKAIQYHLTQSVKELRLYLKDFIFLLIILLSL